jgi:hypothetical protein
LYATFGWQPIGFLPSMPCLSSRHMDVIMSRTSHAIATLKRVLFHVSYSRHLLDFVTPRGTIRNAKLLTI